MLEICNATGFEKQIVVSLKPFYPDAGRLAERVFSF